MVRSVFKCLGLILIIVATSALVRSINNSNIDNAISRFHLSANDAVSFVGSSRVRRSINEILIEKKINGVAIHNAGLSGSTFLANSIMAEQLLRSRSNMVVYVELSVLLPEVPTKIFSYSSYLDSNVLNSVSTVTKYLPQAERTELQMQVYSSFLFDQLHLDLPILFDEEKRFSWLGYMSDQSNGIRSNESFLTYEEVTQKNQTNNFETDSYLKIIESLIESARKNGNVIIFHLPINYRLEFERKLLVELFHEIPDQHKLLYDKCFMYEIRNQKYLIDKVHLNHEGGIRYSEYMVQEIKKQLPRLQKSNCIF